MPPVLLCPASCLCKDGLDLTLFSGGDLSVVGVNLEQEDVLVVGDLGLQAVVQLSVWGL